MILWKIRRSRQDRKKSLDPSNPKTDIFIRIDKYIAVFFINIDKKVAIIL